jgi:chromosome segregation ATPase
VERPGVGDLFPETDAAIREDALHTPVEPSQQRAELPGEREELLAEVRRLEEELERYRAHAQRTSKLFLSATNYAEWVRQSARRDAELALRKARAKVVKLEDKARELERTERELVRVQDELARLQALTDETRTRLSAFLTAGLQVLNNEMDTGNEDSPKLAPGDLQGALQGRLPSVSVPTPERQGRRPDR